MKTLRIGSLCCSFVLIPCIPNSLHALNCLHLPPQLWYAYLKERRTATRGMRIDHPAVASLNNTYERALVSMHKMPRIWLDYLELLVEQKLVTRTRRTFDRALAALPITQHDRVWVLYLVRGGGYQDPKLHQHLAQLDCSYWYHGLCQSTLCMTRVGSRA